LSGLSHCRPATDRRAIRNDVYTEKRYFLSEWTQTPIISPTKYNIMPSPSSQEHLVPTRRLGSRPSHSTQPDKESPLRTADLGKYTLPFPSSVSLCEQEWDIQTSAEMLQAFSQESWRSRNTIFTPLNGSDRYGRWKVFAFQLKQSNKNQCSFLTLA